MQTQDQIECPRCDQFKTDTVSRKSIVFRLGVVSTFIGCLLSIFVIGIPFLFVGILLMAASLPIRESGEMRCKGCGFLFNKKNV